MALSACVSCLTRRGATPEVFAPWLPPEGGERDRLARSKLKRAMVVFGSKHNAGVASGKGRTGQGQGWSRRVASSIIQGVYFFLLMVTSHRSCDSSAPLPCSPPSPPRYHLQYIERAMRSTIREEGSSHQKRDHTHLIHMQNGTIKYSRQSAENTKY